MPRHLPAPLLTDRCKLGPGKPPCVSRDPCQGEVKSAPRAFQGRNCVRGFAGADFSPAERCQRDVAGQEEQDELPSISLLKTSPGLEAAGGMSPACCCGALHPSSACL